MNGFRFDLQRFAWTRATLDGDNGEYRWRYTGDGLNFSLQGDISPEDEDSRSSAPDGVTVSGSTVTISDYSYVYGLTVTSGSVTFQDEVDRGDPHQFQAVLGAGEAATSIEPDDIDAFWSVTSGGYLFMDGYYYDSDVTIVDFDTDSPPSARLNTSIVTGDDGFEHVSVNTGSMGVDTDSSIFQMNGINYKIVDTDSSVVAIAPNITNIAISGSNSIAFTDSEGYESTDTDLASSLRSALNNAISNRFAKYENGVLKLSNDAITTFTSEAVEIAVEENSSGVHASNDKFVAFLDNDADMTFMYDRTVESDDEDGPLVIDDPDDRSWTWYGVGSGTSSTNTNTVHLADYTILNVTNVDTNANFVFTEVEDNDSISGTISVSGGAVLNNASISSGGDPVAISGTDSNPNNGYLIYIGTDEDNNEIARFEDDMTPVLSRIDYNADGTFTFTGLSGSNETVMSYEDVSNVFATIEGGISLTGAFPDVDVTINSARDGLVLIDDIGVFAKLNIGDAFITVADVNDTVNLSRVITDANAKNAWLAGDGNEIYVSTDETLISGISNISSTTEIVLADDGSTIAINGATLTDASVNGVAISGTDYDPSDGYIISVSADGATFINSQVAIVDYDGTNYKFLDSSLNEMSYSSASLQAQTMRGGLLLTSTASDDITISSSVDGFVIYNTLDDGSTAIMAKLNAGDGYYSDSISGHINDSQPLNAWIADADGSVMAFGASDSLVTLNGARGISSLTNIEYVDDDEVFISGVTLNNASINGVAIAGIDNDPTDGYLVTISSEGTASFADSRVASVSYSSNGSFRFYDQAHREMSYSSASVQAQTTRGGLQFTADISDKITISSAADGLVIYDSSSVAAAKVNRGDVYMRNGSEVRMSDASPVNAWISSGNMLNIGNNSTMTIGGVSGVSSITAVSVSADGDHISLTGATITSGSFNGKELSGTDNDPSNGYDITISGDRASLVNHGVSRIVYNTGRNFTFYDNAGATLSYSTASVSAQTVSGGILITSSAADQLTISSAADDLVIYNVSNNGSSVAAAKLNSGDVYTKDKTSVVISDASPINAWRTNSSRNELIIGNNGSITIDGVSNISSSTAVSVSADGNSFTMTGATLNNAAVNGKTIGGKDYNPADGYHVTIDGDSAAYIDAGIANISYTNSGFSFTDANGTSMTYDQVSLQAQTISSGICLTTNAPENVTIKSTVDDFNIYKALSNGSTISAAKINAEDVYYKDSGSGKLDDSKPLNAWTANNAQNALAFSTTTTKTKAAAEEIAGHSKSRLLKAASAGGLHWRNIS